MERSQKVSIGIKTELIEGVGQATQRVIINLNIFKQMRAANPISHSKFRETIAVGDAMGDNFSSSSKCPRDITIKGLNRMKKTLRTTFPKLEL